jgi:hypothetical protein
VHGCSIMRRRAAARGRDRPRRKPVKVTLALADGWRRKDDWTWRVQVWPIRLASWAYRRSKSSRARSESQGQQVPAGLREGQEQGRREGPEG